MKLPAVLIVDDEARMRDLIRLYLQKDYRVLEAPDGLAAIRLMNLEHPDLVLLDVMMPGLDGMNVLARIREESGIPVIMLTARGDVPDRIQGLKSGADDYIAKPFDGMELLARIEAVLRRTSSLTEGQTVIRRGRLTINVQDRIASWKGQPLPLTPKEFDLLTLLAAHPGQAFPRERLLDRVWGTHYEGDTRTVDSHIKNLREKLREGAAMIATVWGVGYRFVETSDEQD